MNSNSIPAPDHLAIAVRCFANTATKYKPSNNKTNPSMYTLIFDCETTTDPTQALRFGVYQWREKGELLEAGLFYDPLGVDSREVELIQHFAVHHGLECRTVDNFIDEVFFGYAYDLGARIVGFNLPFDVSRLAKEYGSARGSMRRGFTFRLSTDKRRPNVQIKSINSLRSLIQFAHPFKQLTPRGMRKRGQKVKPDRGTFIDVRSLASALLSGSHSLHSLSELLNVPCKKQVSEEHGKKLKYSYLRYCHDDVESTWQCFERLEQEYNALGLQVPIQNILSEASVGKASLQAMGIRPWQSLQADFPKDLLGKILSTYYGGRSEVHLRRQVTRVVYSDFLSMYPTVCTKMGLWQFVIAQGMTWRDGTSEVRDFLEGVNINTFSSPDAWSKLCAIVRVKPKVDLLPVRADYGDTGSRTIGLNYLTSEQPLWFTLADCVTAKLLTGKTPDIEEAMIFEPGPPQEGLKPILVRGNKDYRVDPVQDDFYKRLIELRQQIKGRRKCCIANEWQRLNADQQTLKLMANATSYGIFVEVNVRTSDEASPVEVFGPKGSFSTTSKKVEQPGKCFHPLLASLITGAARLLLAMVECKISEAGLDWAFCDTDSMAIARPEGMAEADFTEKVRSICIWFDSLSPYDGGGSLLKIEDQNFDFRDKKELTELNCLAVSAKRYVLFNLVDNKPVIRKASSHGLGHLVEPYSKRPATPELPLPCPEVLADGTRLWHHDLWYQIIRAELNGHGSIVDYDYHRSLSSPAFSRLRVSTPEQLRWFKAYNQGKTYRQSVKPFNFMLTLSSPADRSLKPVAPYDKEPAKVLRRVFDRQTGEPVKRQLLSTYGEVVAQYHLHPEAKFHNGDFLDQGATARRHVISTGISHIGKESDRWEEKMHGATDEAAEIAYEGSYIDWRTKFEQLRVDAEGMSITRIARCARLSTKHISNILKGRSVPSEAALQSISRAIGACRSEEETAHASRIQEIKNLQARIQADGLRATARNMGVDPSNLSRNLRRKRN